ncbi:hypothetical protein GCM10022206_27160 [Streptomyces chiangmaiensis]
MIAALDSSLWPAILPSGPHKTSGFEVRYPVLRAAGIERLKDSATRHCPFITTIDGTATLTPGQGG